MLTEFRSEDVERVRTYALYVRVRPWKKVPFDIQAGRIPPVFGVFGRHSYGADNPLIGYPLAYQYLTSLRPDAIPATADDLLSMRARGWQASYPVGSQVPSPGVPLVTAYRWDTGVRGASRHDRVEGGGGDHGGHAVQSARPATTTTGGRSPAAWPGSRPWAWSSGRRLPRANG